MAVRIAWEADARLGCSFGRSSYARGTGTGNQAAGFQKKIGLEPQKLTAVTQLPTVLYMLIRLHCGAYLQGLGG